MMTQMEPQSLNTPQISTSEEVALSAPISSRVSPWLAPLAYFLGCRIVLPLHFGKITTSGQENLPTTGPVILAPTHRSRWDAVIVPAVTGRTVTGRDLTFMVSANEASGLQGWFVRRLGGFLSILTVPQFALCVMALRYFCSKKC